MGMLNAAPESKSPKTLFLFGAGASAFAGGIHPSPPPLGFNLFEELCCYHEFFRQIEEPLKERFQGSFERGMAEFARHHSAGLDKFLCLMALFFLRYKIEDPSKNLYCRLVDLWRMHPDRVLYFATLNYDLLLDEALVRAGVMSWHSHKILKLHGAPNYLVADASKNNMSGITMVNVATRVDGPVTLADPEYARNYCEVSIRNQNGLAPAISIYAPGKTVYHSPQVVKQNQKTFAECVALVDSIVLVGIQLIRDDTHIWDVLAATNARLAIVNPDRQPYVDWGNAHNRDIVFLCDKADEMVGSHANQLLGFCLR